MTHTQCKTFEDCPDNVWMSARCESIRYCTWYAVRVGGVWRTSAHVPEGAEKVITYVSGKISRG